MTSILSTISGYFSKSLILGTFMPVAVFVILALLVPFFPDGFLLFRPLEQLETQWKVVAISFIIILISGMIYNLNIPIIRLYEGYVWKDSLIGQIRTRHYQSKFDAVTSRDKRMAALLLAMDPDTASTAYQQIIRAEIVEKLGILCPHLPALASEGTRTATHSTPDDQWIRLYSAILDEWNFNKRRVNSEFPGERSLVLPTRLGNVIRSYEYYPEREYKIDSITLWPRLIACIDKEYAVSIDDAKISFDFMINSSALSAMMVLLLLIAGLAYPAHLASASLFWQWLIEIISFALASYIFYFLSIYRAGAWGDMVKSAFDLYRWKLLDQLGYKQELKSKDEERSLWDAISLQMILGDRQSGPRITGYASEPPSVEPATFARCVPSDVQLELTRGIRSRSYDGALKIILRVENVDDKGRIARDVVLTDTPPEGFEYEWGSARVDGELIDVSGINPYRFEIGHLRPQAQSILTYWAARSAKREGLKDSSGQAF